MSRKDVAFVSGVILWFALATGWATGVLAAPADRNEQAAQVERKRQEADQAVRQLSVLDARVADQNRKIDQLQDQLGERQATVADLDRQLVELRTGGGASSQMAQAGQADRGGQTGEFQVEQGLLLAQLQGEIVRQQNRVDFLAEIVRQQDATALESDDFERDRQVLRRERQRLNDLRYGLSAAQAEMQAARSAETRMAIERDANRRLESQVIEESRKAAAADAARLQADLTRLQEEERRAQAQREELQVRRQRLVTELAELEARS